MNTDLTIHAIRILLAGVAFLRKLGVNYQEVIDAQDAAVADGRDGLNDQEAQVFIDQGREANARL